MNRIFLILSGLLMLFTASLSVSAQTDSIAFSGQAIGWAGMNFGSQEIKQVGVRFLPVLFYQHSYKNKVKLDVDLSANAYYGVVYHNWTYDNNLSGLKPYRASFRLSSDQWEVRAGLQKISFGSATLLRPLMWFDGIDPRDPLQLTDGVYGLLGRYYFLNNANIWIWGLLGNKNQRGWDYVPTLADKPEFGGRIQLPVLHGELGLSYNHREPGTDKSSIPGILQGTPLSYTEDKTGLDGKWTIGPGVWFEYVIKHNTHAPEQIPSFENYLNVGSDYTFSWGNGLNLVAEHFLYSGFNSYTGNYQTRNFTVGSLSYPFGLLNRASVMVYRGWDDKSWYRFINLQRQYDNLSLYFMLFWNPETFSLYTSTQGSNLYSGKGFQLMATYNF